MIKDDIKSVQLINCTEKFEQKIYNIFTQKKKNPFQTHFFHRFKDPARFSDQTLHSLWKAGMQMCRWTRPWPQILSLRQPTWPQARTRLCTSKIPGTSQAISGQLSENKAPPRRDLHHQSRALTTERKTVKAPDGYYFRPLNPYRYRDCRNFSCQYAPGLFSRSFRRALPEGGEQ